MSKNPKNINNLPENLVKKNNKINQEIKPSKTSTTKNKNQDKNISNKEGTIKDPLAELGTYTKKDSPYKNEPTLNKNNNKRIKQNTINIHQSSLETTPTINKSTETNTIFSQNVYNSNSENINNLGSKNKNIKLKLFNYQKFVINEKISGKIITESECEEDTLNNDNLVNEKTSSDIIECNSNETLLNKINIDILNRIKIIYEEMKLQFSNNDDIVEGKIQNINNKDEISSEKYENYFKARVLAFDYFQFLFGDDIKLIIRSFNYCLEIGEFILTQIYLFLGILFFEQNQKIENIIQLSYRTAFLYSGQNFNSLISSIQNPFYISEPKKMKIMKNKNKIIISILKTININNQANKLLKKIIDENMNFIGNFPCKCLEDICKFSKTKSLKTLISEYNLNVMNNSSNNKSIGIINLLLIIHDNRIFKNQFYSILQQAKNNSEFSENFKEDINKKSLPNLFNFIYLNNEKLLLKYERKNNEEQNLLVPPFTKNANIKYHVIIDLDETLVHYCEEKYSYYVKVRYGVENFLQKISDFCEIIIFSISGKEYTDIIVNNMNKGKGYVKNIIYKEIYDELNENELNLSNINRNLNKCIFICHEKQFYGAPLENILQLSEFVGDDSDREIVYLQNEFAKIEKINVVTDVSYLITDIMFGINHEKRKNQLK